MLPPDFRIGAGARQLRARSHHVDMRESRHHPKYDWLFSYCSLHPAVKDVSNTISWLDDDLIVLYATTLNPSARYALLMLLRWRLLCIQ